MRKIYTAFPLLLALLFTGNAFSQIQPAPQNVSMKGIKPHTGLTANANRTVTCGPDTVQYTLQKASTISGISLNNATSARAAAQYYNCPQPLTISGFSFFAVKGNTTGGVSLNATCSIYLAAADSTPTGTPLATTTVTVDTTFPGTLAGLEKFANFTTPVTVTAPYVLVVDNNTPNGMSLYGSSYTAGDGGGEYLVSVQIGANWLRGYQVNVGGSPYDADFFMYPYTNYDLTADFTQSTGCIANGDTVCFTNNSSPVISDRMYSLAAYFGIQELSHNYDFGDGGAGNAVDTCYVYNTAGNYTTTLVDTLFGWTTNCVDDTTNQVVVPATPGFSSAISGLTVTFTDTSTGGTSYSWDFGDGTNSSLQNPVKTYSVDGTYLVCQTVTNACGNTVFCDTITIVCAQPTASYGSAGTGYTYAFTDSSSGATAWAWDFGDGSTSTSQNPNYTYATTGTYTVCLIVSNICGADTTCQSLSVTCPAPTAAFSDTSNLFVANFTNMSTGTGTATYLWDFGDGNTSTMMSPTHTYASAGNYTVCLTTTDVCGSDSSCQTVTITCPTPTPAFGFAGTQDTVVFSNTSTGTGAATYLWDFGDGNTSTDQGPTHVYTAPGTYLVCLTVTDVCGSDSTCQNIVITCPAPVAAFTSNVNNDSVAFANSSTNASGATYAWDFGDGGTSTVENPSHIYTSSGTYNVCLTVTSSCGTNTFCDSVAVVIIGLDDVLAGQVSLYPNPTRGQLQVELGFDQIRNTEVSIISLHGQVLRTFSFGEIMNRKESLDLNGLQSGMYLVRIQAGDAVTTKRIQLMR